MPSEKQKKFLQQLNNVNPRVAIYTTELSVDHKEKETKLYKCNLCQHEKILRCHPSSVANIKKHLKQCHKITTFRKRRKLTVPVNMEILKLPIETNDPLSMVENISSPEFVIDRNKEKLLETTETLQGDILERLEQFNANLRNQLGTTPTIVTSDSRISYPERNSVRSAPEYELSLDQLSIGKRKEEIKLVLKNVKDPEQVAEILAYRMKEISDRADKASDEAKKEMENRIELKFQLEQLKNQVGIIEARTIIDEIETELLLLSPAKNDSEMLEVLTDEQKNAIATVTAFRGGNDEDTRRTNATSFEEDYRIHFTRWLYFCQALRNNIMIAKIRDKIDDPTQFSLSVATVYAKTSAFPRFCSVAGISHENIVNSLKLHKFSQTSVNCVETILKVLHPSASS